MHVISHAEFFVSPEICGSSVHCDMYLCDCADDGLICEGSDARYPCCSDRGCVIYQENRTWCDMHYFTLYIHQTSPDADIDAVAVDWTKIACKKAAAYANAEVRIFVYVV